MGGSAPVVTATSHHVKDAPNSISIPWVVAAAVLIGIGLFLISVWLLTFDLLFFSGTLVLLVGALMVFDPRMGSDHA